MDGKPSLVRRIGPYLFLVILGPSLGCLVAYLLLRPEPPPLEPPVRLPSLPSPATDIAGVRADYFGEANVDVQTADGTIHVWRGPRSSSDDLQGQAWLPSSATPQDYDDQPCLEPSVALIELSARSVSECRMVVTMSEWCPGTRVSYAVDGRGDVWSLTEYYACWGPLLHIGLVYLIPLGALVGFMAALLLWVVRRARAKRREAQSHTGPL